MRKIFIPTAVVTSILIAFVFFSFYIHRWLPVAIQWFYPMVMVALVFFLHHLVAKTLAPGTTNYAKRIVFSLPIIVLFIIGLYNISSINREFEAANFVKQNEARLKNIMNTGRTPGDAEKVRLASDLNIKLLSIGAPGEHHFELYGCLGYGYRLLFAEQGLTGSPTSPGGSPTRKWFKLKDNWYYYSYLD